MKLRLEKKNIVVTKTSAEMRKANTKFSASSSIPAFFIRAGCGDVEDLLGRLIEQAQDTHALELTGRFTVYRRFGEVCLSDYHAGHHSSPLLGLHIRQRSLSSSYRSDDRPHALSAHH